MSTSTLGSPARSRQQEGALALAVLRFGLAGCVLAFAGTLGAVVWKIVAG